MRKSAGLNASLPSGAAREAVEALGRRIVAGIWPPGATIPIEPELAQVLGVSRATVRDAVKVLSGKGLLRTARRYGTRVRPLEEWHLLDPDVAAWHGPAHPRIGRMFAETTELRCAIEPAAAALAAQRATPEQVRTLLAAAEALRPGEVDIVALFEADRRFHCTILDATDNLMMRQLQGIITTILRISYEFGVQKVDGRPVSREGHFLVAEAVARGDAAGARREMERMLDLNRAIAEAYWRNRAMAENPAGAAGGGWPGV
ncbi:FadR/GntR family transcriptional regulator [Rubellimicrobium roseum]|uniref:FadR/GntR family transcriptional regulator n=1 Tax=Rubellimicrobium roseum TaxID=687525 RepID=UPI00159B9B80|nr:FCD domain-containing protein [Rubellimicrobium roseum]